MDLSKPLVFYGLMLMLALTLLIFDSGCATTYMERKRSRILECVKDLRQNEFKAEEAERICRGASVPIYANWDKNRDIGT